MTKIVVLDTNLLLSDPSLESFNGQEVYIPIFVYKELDKQKGYDGIVGYRARLVNRKLKKSKMSECGAYYDYEALGKVKIIKPTQEFERRIDPSLEERIADDAFLNMGLFTEHGVGELHTADFSLYQLMSVNNRNTILVKDMQKENYENVYTDVRVIYAGCDMADGQTMEKDWASFDPEYFNSYPNEYLQIRNGNSNRLAKVKKGRLEPVKEQDVFGFKGKNREQRMLIDALLDEDIKVVILTGGAGTGKTFLTLASGLQQIKDGKYDTMILAKSLAPLSKEEQVGFLKGELYQKLIPQFSNFTSNLETLFGGRFKFRKDDNMVLANMGSQILMHQIEDGNMDIMSLDSVLGASYHKKFVIIDEAQSLNYDSLRCILTRISDDCKLVLLGDVLQRTATMKSIDNSALFIANKYLKKANSVATITLKKVERGTACGEIQKLLEGAEL